VNWLAAQEHSGENIGTTETHVLFVELKDPPQSPRQGASLATGTVSAEQDVALDVVVLPVLLLRPE